MCSLTDFDFIRIATPDLNGCHMSKLVPVALANKIVKNEVNLYGGSVLFGVRNQYVPFQELIDNNSRNAFLYSDLNTLRPIEWAYDKVRGFKVGEVIADMRWDCDNPVRFHSRILAKEQITKLDEMGFELYSAFEPEFRAFKLNDKYEPFTTSLDMYKTSLSAVYEKFFMDATHNLAKANVAIQDCMVEHGEGQLEMPLLPMVGIDAADCMFRFKQAVKEIALQHGMRISFMTRPFASVSSSGNHFNHSLRDKRTCKSVMYDSNGIDNLSQTTRYWLGGIMKHLRALSAFCSPTVNCWARLHNFLAPGKVNWDINNRNCSIRVKCGAEESATYIENRLPSSAANPYLVLAATVAAGIDGLQNKIEPPTKGEASESKLPTSLEEAMTVLEQDKELTAALGNGVLVEYFTKIRREIDLKEVICVNNADKSLIAQQLDMERRLYFEYI